MIHTGFAAKAAALVLAGAALLPITASAATIHGRFHDQQGRINQGVNDGQLTRGEYNRDERDLNRIEAQRNRDLRRDPDHDLTAGQRAHLNRELNQNSRNIYFTKHNERTQPGENR